MLTVEIKKRNHYVSNSQRIVKNYVCINGKDDLDSEYLPAERDVVFRDPQIAHILLDYTFQEVSEYFYLFSFPVLIDEWGYETTLTILCSKLIGEYVPQLWIDFKFPELQEWNKPYTFIKFVNEIEKFLTSNLNSKYSLPHDVPLSKAKRFKLAYKPNNINSTILYEYNDFLSFFNLLVSRVNRNLLSNDEDESVVSHFNFPEEIRTSCNQYLMYFSQFLADCGIAVDTEIKEGINETLFRVNPRDKDESLEKIKSALDIYLTIPSNPNFTSDAAGNTDVAVMQLQSTVLNLQSQLMLAKSMYQMNQATIESLQLNNFQLKGMLETSASKPSEDQESLFKGVVSVKKVEVPGFSFELPEILRKLKRRFGKK